jgi:hypothetical protein
MNLIIITVLVAALQYALGWDWRAWIRQLGPLKLFAIWAFSFLPGWLFIRFLGQRAGAVWREFVLYLHRLGVDEPQYLPEPPLHSRYHRDWLKAGGAHSSEAATIYQEKFDAYYGKAVSRMVADDSPWVRTETTFPLFLTTAVLAAGWTGVLWDLTFSTNPSGPTDMLKFGFIGSYSFIIQMLMRRFFQSDLKASAYASAVLRVFVVAILVGVVHQITAIRDHPEIEAIVAFVIGFFPLAGMQVLQRVGAAALRVAVPSLTPAYPLSQIDGLNVWYEARLLEEGIEDMQNLATANLVDVILHTHVPVGRLIDWVDQAHLYQHLDRTERTLSERFLARRRARPGARSRRKGGRPGEGNGSSPGGEEDAVPNPSEGARGFREGSRMRHGLRTLGIRTATDLLKVMPLDDDPSPIVSWLNDRGLDGEAIRTLSRVLDREPGLRPVWNWQTGSAPVRA